MTENCGNGSFRCQIRLSDHRRTLCGTLRTAIGRCCESTANSDQFVTFGSAGNQQSVMHRNAIHLLAPDFGVQSAKCGHVISDDFGIIQNRRVAA